MCLRFVFLLTTQLAGWLRLSQREETWQTAEILILRHQLAVLQRRQPRRPKLMAGLGVTVAASTVWEILKTSGIGPARRRTGPAWSQFLRSQAEAILACDFFTLDLLGGSQAYVLAVIEHAARRVRILGVTLHRAGEWTTQQARNLLMDLGGQTHQVKFMIRDRGSNFTAASDAVLTGAGI
jgi:putative transposase